MTQELYIDGMRVDLPPDIITLQYRSNLFGDIDKITSSNSLTIRLPKTPNNNKVMNFADLPFTTGIARDWHDAVYCRDGIQVVRGKVALLSANREEYEVALIWGIVARLSELLNGDYTLRDIPINFPSRIVENKIENFSKSVVAYGNMYYNNGGERYAFPVMNAGLLFDRILGSEFIGGVDRSLIDVSFVNSLYVNIVEDLVDKVGTATFLIRDYLPEIKQVEFVKAICHLCGWYFELTPEGVLQLVPTTIVSDRSRAVDWSDKLMSYGNIPDSIEFDYNNHAQRNWMRYKEDKEVAVNADGYIEVEDKTLQRENTLFTLPFAPTNGSLIRQYITTLNDDGEPTTSFVKIEPRILTYTLDGPLDENGDPIPSLEFSSDMYFQRLIGNYYGYLSDVMRSPVVIEARFNLTDFELMNIDYTRPVYIAQYGGYYAIMEITNQGYDSSVKLIKLP